MVRPSAGRKTRTFLGDGLAIFGQWPDRIAGVERDSGGWRRLRGNWGGADRTGKMTLDDITVLLVREVAAEQSHLFLWVPNFRLRDGLEVIEAWGVA